MVIAKKRRQKLIKWMECTWRRIPCGKDSCPICGRINRDRARHLEAGEDPDSPQSAFGDVGITFKEVLETIKQDAARHGFEISNLEKIQEPPPPSGFSFYRKLALWHGQLTKMTETAEVADALWIYMEAGADLLWYKNILLTKVYRQLCNRWHLKRGDGYGEFDYEYTQYVLGECLKILKKSLNELSSSQSPQQGIFFLSLADLLKLEKKIMAI